jgi:RNA polymerase sigma-70 factor (ECF subfamily)
MNTSEFNTRVTILSPKLKPFALSLTRHTEDAQDLLQETVYRAILNQKSFTEGTNLKAWVYTIMKNLFINDYRKKKQRNTYIEIKEDLSYISGATSTASNEGESNMGVSVIMQKMNKLSMGHRDPFMMHHIGFKYDEIAGHLKLPIGTVKSRIHLARKSLQVMLAEAPVCNS